jgi:hypothetical protein
MDVNIWQRKDYGRKSRFRGLRNKVKQSQFVHVTAENAENAEVSWHLSRRTTMTVLSAVSAISAVDRNWKNKANFRMAQMKATAYFREPYGNMRRIERAKNKANQSMS